MRRTGAVLAVALALPLILAACGGDSGSSSSAGSGSGESAKVKPNEVSVKITEAGCDPAVLDLPAGATTFKVQNDGASKVTEYEVLDGDRILGEAENIAPGLSGEFSLTLRAGDYTTYCPGGSTQERGTLKVTGELSPGADEGANTLAGTAVSTYRTYVEQQTKLLQDSSAAFIDAVKAGDVAKAKELYGPARIPYERIEPVAESFGDLDPKIDARAGDVPAAEWTGFHPLERALWVKGSLAGTEKLADQLETDIDDLATKVKTVELEPAQIANGAVELLGEVSKSKITGEEERYSHTDLVDFLANVEGSHAAFNALRPIVSESDPDLADTIDERFDDVVTALEPYRRGDGFVSYTELTDNDTRKLSQSIDALAEPLSQVGKLVVTASAGTRTTTTE
jgi:iron uptake system component EfeO